MPRGLLFIGFPTDLYNLGRQMPVRNEPMALPAVLECRFGTDSAAGIAVVRGIESDKQ
jgi:hypothetical protein